MHDPEVYLLDYVPPELRVEVGRAAAGSHHTRPAGCGGGGGCAPARCAQSASWPVASARGGIQPSSGRGLGPGPQDTGQLVVPPGLLLERESLAGCAGGLAAPPKAKHTQRLVTSHHPWPRVPPGPAPAGGAPLCGGLCQRHGHGGVPGAAASAAQAAHGGADDGHRAGAGQEVNSVHAAPALRCISLRLCAVQPT